MFSFTENNIGQAYQGAMESMAMFADNYRAAFISQSKAGFVTKLSIVIEESDERNFWLEFIMDEDLLSKEKVTLLFTESEELNAIFYSYRKTARKNSK